MRFCYNYSKKTPDNDQEDSRYFVTRFRYPKTTISEKNYMKLLPWKSVTDELLFDWLGEHTEDEERKKECKVD